MYLFAVILTDLPSADGVSEIISVLLTTQSILAFSGESCSGKNASAVHVVVLPSAKDSAVFSFIALFPSSVLNDFS